MRFRFLIPLLFSLLAPLSSHATVTTQTISVSFTCTGSTGPFPFTFSVSAPAALTVTQNGTVLATTAYITTPVNNNYDNGGSVTLNAACPSGQTLVLTRVTPLTQASKFADNMPVPMKSFENGLDKLTEINQEQAASLLQFGNSLQNAKCTGTSALQSVIGPTCIPVGTGTGPGSSFQLPVTTYLAVGDGQLVTDGAMSSGSHTLTSASAQFTSSSCGPTKVISVQYAGGTGGSNQPLVTTCTYVNATTLTLAGAAATQPVSAAGVIWGTDNYTAFAQWAAALPGNAGIIPSGNFLVNTAQSTRTINLGSNESITFNRNGNIYYVGDLVGAGFGSLFSIPSGTTNLQIDSPHIIGEFQNQATTQGVRQGFGDGDAFQFINSSTTNTVQITNGLFSNLLGIGVKDVGSLDTNETVTGNTFINSADTAINLNSQYSNISNNVISGAGPGIEASGAWTIINNNTLNGVGGQYAIAAGGVTSGTPYIGSTVSGNIINSPTSTTGCISISDGFTYGVVSNNKCLNLPGSIHGIVNPYDGFTVTGHNLFQGNYVLALGNGGNCIFDNGANNDTFVGNVTNCDGNGLVVTGATGIVSRSNIWKGNVGKDLALGFGASGSFQDRIENGSFTLTGGGSTSTFDADTILTNTAGIVFSAPPISIFTTPVVGPEYTSVGSASSGNTTNTPFSSGNSGYNIFKLHLTGASPTSSNSVVDAGPVNAGSLNNSHTWWGSEYNADFSSDFAVFTAEVGNSSFTPIQALRALTLSSDAGNTYAYGALKGSLCVGTACDDPLISSKGDGNILYKASLIGPSTAPSGSCSRVGWSLNGDGTATYCNGSTWSQPFASSGGVTQINATPGAYTFAFSAGAGSCTGTTCTFTGTSTGGGTVTNAIAGTIPSWLALSIATSTTTPTFNFTATSQAQNLFLASPNGSSGALSPRAIVAADVPTLNQNTSGNAATASALAASPTNCSTGAAPQGINASGTAQNCTTYVQTICTATQALSTTSIAPGGVNATPVICTGAQVGDIPNCKFTTSVAGITGYDVTINSGNVLTIDVPTVQSPNSITVNARSSLLNTWSGSPGAISIKCSITR